MEGLTFGEQVKIILKRKGMTIKELAETIEAHTGKAMSRQNLTQRLGRDNFQEQDMRMIAAILECPFHLSIFPDGAEQTSCSFDTPALEQPGKPGESRQAEQPGDTEGPVQRQETVQPKEPEYTPQAGKAEERDITIGELYAIHEELDELEKSLRSGGAEVPEEDGTPLEAETLSPEEGAETVLEESLSEEQDGTAQEEGTDLKAVSEEGASFTEGSSEEDILPERETALPEESYGTDSLENAAGQPEEPELKETRPKKERFLGGRIFMRRKSNAADEEEKKEEVKEAAEEKPKERKEPGLSRRITKEIVLPDREQAIAESELVEEEDLTLGEINPYTRHEYESNSVRMHPSRIGYVQVYDRAQHKWTDMTEWAFLGYQERKKALLGDKYEPPIYLD